MIKHIHNLLVSISILWITAGLWLLEDGLKTLTGVGIVFLVFTLVTTSPKELSLRIRDNKLIISSLLFTAIVIIIKEYYGGIYGSFMRSCIIFSILFLCIYSPKTNKLSISLPIILGAILNILYVLYIVYIERQHRPTAMMNPNLYAPLFGCFAILAFYFIKPNQHSYITITSCFLFLSLLLCVILMYSRGVLVASIFSLCILFIYKLKKYEHKIIITLSLISIVIFSGFMNKHRIEHLYNKSAYEYQRIIKGDLNSSIGLRIQMLDVGLTMISEKPLIGHGSNYKQEKTKVIIEDNKNQVINSFGTLHNVYIDTWAKLGILGFIATIFLTFLPLLILKGSEHWILGLSLSSFNFIISSVDTVLLGGPYLLVVTSVCLILKLSSLANKDYV
jgi:O-antigen ligase